MNYGLKPTVPDERDFKLGSFVQLPSLSELPASFRFSPLSIKDQRQTDFCSAFMSAGMSELQEGVELSPEWLFAKSKELSGKPEEWGQDIRTALQTHTKHGAVPKAKAPYSVEKKDAEFLRYIKNWPVLDTFAIPHFKKSYAKVTGPYDHFDNIRATIWKFRSERRAVGTGVIWGWPKDQRVINTIAKNGEGHALYINGWTDDDHLEYVNSWGPKAGNKGSYYFHRDVVNFFVDIYGAYTFLDMDKETIKYMVRNGITDRDSRIVELMKVTLTLLKELLAVKKKLQ